MATQICKSILRTRPQYTQVRPHNRRPTYPTCASKAHFSRLNRSTPTTEINQALKADGCVVIKSLLSPSQITHLNKDMDSALTSVRAGHSANPTAKPLPAGLEPGDVYGTNTKRMGDLINRSPTWRDDIVNSDILHAVSEEAMRETGDYWLNTAEMIEIGPGTQAQTLHADGGGWWSFWSMTGKWKPEFQINFLIATTPTTKANGATGVVRGSHTLEYPEDMTDESFRSWDFPEEQVETVELEAGDCLVLSSRIVHRGGANVTSEEFRRVLSVMVLSSAFTPEYAHALTVDRETARRLPERVKKFLGFRGQKMVLGPDVWQDYNEEGGMRMGV
ncbi:hypothetical protein Q7P37_006212 [Cladosporium fusiforme]